MRSSTPERADPIAVARGVAQALRSEAKDRGLSLWVLTSPLVDQVAVDAAPFRQCLMYVVGEALSSTRAGGVEIRLTLAGDGRLRCEVEDTGDGLPETAIGLAIARNIVRAMGGALVLDSRSGEGSTVRFEVATAVSAGAARAA